YGPHISFDGGLTHNRGLPRRHAHYPPHSHSGLTTHLVVSGQMTLWYPNESDREKVKYGAGARIDVDAERVHEVWIGERGCTYVIGE
ncbi:hypothetical protein E4U28_000468, partial [Claviceps purpurea]